MAQSVRNIISIINQALEGVFKGSRVYGVASLVEREGKGLPVVDEQAVSFDDIYALQIYHRLNAVGITYKPGYGNTQNTVNAFTVSMVVFNNENTTKLKTDEIAMIIQSVLAGIKINSIRVLPTQIILNSQAVWGTEYKGTTYSLNEYQSLMQINYTVEISFKGICLDLCPEDFIKCKN